jgi:hypothetical protein
MKNAKGHGSEKRKTAVGQFLKALDGTHRDIPGHGEVPTGQGVPPVVRHSHCESVGTEPLAEVSARGATTFGSK